jgi:hypothetical protein
MYPDRSTPCVILDTNIWRSSVLLRSNLGAALLYVLHRRGGRIGLPEVVEDEIHKHLLSVGREAVKKIERGFRDLLSISGTHRRYNVPSVDQIQGAIDARLIELGDLFERVEFTLDHVRSALVRVNEGSPPNSSKNPQFKDSMIWEAALELGQQYSIHLVTNDSAFYRDNKMTELAPELRTDCENKGICLSIYSDLSGCLEALRVDMPPIDTALLARAAYEAVRPDINRDAESRSARVTDLIDHYVSPFVTEDPDVLALSFKLSADAIDLSSGEVRNDLRMIAKGDCKYSINSGTATEASLDRVIYEWTDETGLQRSFKSAYARGMLYVGSGPDVQFAVREPLE